MVPCGSWISAPTEAFILGLKELPFSDDPISQRHIFFAHAYKVRARKTFKSAPPGIPVT